MSTKTFLYKRPAHHMTKIIEKRGDVTMLAGELPTSAFVGIDAAIRGVAMGNNTLAIAIRILRKLEKAMHTHETSLHHLFVEFTEQEKQIICSAVNQFNWSEFAVQTGNTTWTRWIDFLEAFDTESDAHKSSWTEYDPLKPSVEYAEWRVQYAKDLAAYEQKVAEARAAALAANQNGEGAGDGSAPAGTADGGNAAAPE
jgi:hypothetical protein